MAWNIRQRAKRRLSGWPADKFSLRIGDAAAIPATDGVFDAVFDFGIVHHVPNWQKAVAEIARVLKPGGLFLFEEVTRKGLDRWVYRAFFEHPRQNRFSLEEFVAELGNHGIRQEGPVTTLSFGDIAIGAGGKWESRRRA